MNSVVVFVLLRFLPHADSDSSANAGTNMMRHLTAERRKLKASHLWMELYVHLVWDGQMNGAYVSRFGRPGDSDRMDSNLGWVKPMT